MSAQSHSPHERLLAAQLQPSIGAHLVTPRVGYIHHGIYVGWGTVVHYGAYAAGRWRRRPVEEISLAHFAHGHRVWVRPARKRSLPGAEIARRARSRLGEDRYRFLSNNCEHFSEWCVNGEHRSPQVERLLGRLQCVRRALRRLRRPQPLAAPRRATSLSASAAWLSAEPASGSL